MKLCQVGFSQFASSFKRPFGLVSTCPRLLAAHSDVWPQMPLKASPTWVSCLVVHVLNDFSIH